MTKKNIFILTLLLSTVLLSANFAFADLEITYPEVSGIAKPDSSTNLALFIKYIFNLSIGIGGLLAFAVLIYGGLRWMTSAGNASAIGDARSWMFGGITGLFLLLTSYLVLTAINPNLLIFKEMVPLQSDTGICLCAEATCEVTADLPCIGDNRKYYTINDIPRIDIKEFKPQSIKFISSQDEITSIFIFANPNFVANDENEIIKIDNNNGGETSAPSIPISSDITNDTEFISLSFLKNKPGIYLYQKTNYCLEDPDDESSKYLCKTPPMYISSSIGDLGKKWKQTTKSLKYNGENIGTVLFADNEFTGECGFTFYQNIPDLSKNIGGYYIHAINDSSATSKLSSLKVFNSNLDDLTKMPPGKIIFYDQVNCAGNQKTFDPSDATLNTGSSALLFWYLGTEAGSCNIDGDKNIKNYCTFYANLEETILTDPVIRLHRNIMSYKIDGNFQIVLNTKKIFGGADGLKSNICQILEPNDEGCVVSLTGKNIYSVGEDGRRIESMIIIPTQ